MGFGAPFLCEVGMNAKQRMQVILLCAFIGVAMAAYVMQWQDANRLATIGVLAVLIGGGMWTNRS
jgi:hypothetical protein